MKARVLAALVALVAACIAPGAAQAQLPGGGGGSCFGEFEADDVQRLPGQRLRYGITPGVQAGQVGPVPAEAVPEQRPRTLEALAELRPADGPLVLRLNRLFWSDRRAGIDRFLALAERYTRRGYLVELQLRYHPDEAQEGQIGRWTRYVRRVVRRFGPNDRVVAIQVTNEVNLTVSGDSSDGSFDRARDALVRGVVAAKREARRRGFEQLEIGFNWFYRTDPGNEQSFWEHLRDHRIASKFVDAVDWIGLDAYPDTFFPPIEVPGDERDGMVNAMSTLRCLAAIPGIPETVPMHVEENGWPTPPGRSYERQAEFLTNAVGAVDDFRGTYNVTDYRWFNLRDADTSSPALAQRYGLLEDDYDRKPAFGVYRDFVDARSIREPRRPPQGGSDAQPAGENGGYGLSHGRPPGPRAR